MSEPVLAADGHTYERQAIEKWLQLHNTSPMTGAPLAHRYLTENFALRHVIASYDARMRVRDRMTGDERLQCRSATGALSSADREREGDEQEDEAHYAEDTEEESYSHNP